MRAACLLVLLAILAGMCGCKERSQSGTANSGGPSASAVPVGRAVFTIAWPESSRLVPAAAQSIQVQILLGQGVLDQGIANRPAGGGESRLAFDGLPPGEYVVAAAAYPEANAQGVAQARGTASLTIRDGFTSTVDLTMASTVARVNVAPSTISLHIGQGTSFAYTVLDSAGQLVLVAASSIRWASSNTEVATVDVTGKVTAVGLGTAQISVTDSETTRSGSGTVQVVGAPLETGRIAFTSLRDGNAEIYLVSDGGAAVRLTNNGANDYASAWSPDASRIVYVSENDGNAEIYVMDADGSAQTRLTNNSGRDTNPAWSPDGTRIAFVSNRDGDNEIYVMNADGSGQAALTKNIIDDDMPTWSPDGSKIAFVSRRSGNAEIYVVSADGSDPQINVTNHPASDTRPAWSPDGNLIAFVSDRDGNAEIYVMRADGSAQTNISSHAASDQNPSWSPDGSKIAFDTSRDGNTEVYVMNADGTAQTRATHNSALDGSPAWGAVIQDPEPYSATVAAKPSTVPADGKTSEIVVMVRDGGYRLLPGASVALSTNLGTLSATTATTGANGRTTVTLTSNATGTATITVSVSGGKNPESTTNVLLSPALPGRMAYVSGSGGSAEIFLMQADGSSPAMVPNGLTAEQTPCWSPDGTRIAFVANSGQIPAIYVMEDSGGGPKCLTEDTYADQSPSWSPDGSRIAYASNRGGNWEICVMNADGTGQTCLTNNAVDDLSPAWSPDGRRIVFCSERDANRDIYEMNADGTGVVRLTNHTASDDRPAWSPVGGLIAFVSNRDGHAEVYVMKDDGSEQTRLTSTRTGASDPTWLPDGGKVAFASNSEGNWEIYVTNVDGTGRKRLTHNSVDDRSPAWTLDQQPREPYSVTMTTDPTSTQNTTGTVEITVTVRDGGYRPLTWASLTLSTDLGTLTPPQATDEPVQATWKLTGGGVKGTATVDAIVSGGKNPSAQTQVTFGQFRIAFVSARDGSYHVYTIPDSAAEPQVTPVRITEGTAVDWLPTWSPDGTKIAFCSDREGNYEIHVVKAVGGIPEPSLTRNSAGDYYPAWSPDGTKIAFHSYRDGYAAVYVMNADGTGLRRLTANSGGDYQPSWSPNGAKIAFHSYRDKKAQIYVMKADGTEQTRLVESDAGDTHPVWSPDGNRIAFVSNRTGDEDIWVVNVNSNGEAPGDPVNLTDNMDNARGDYQPSWSPNGRQIAFSSYRYGDLEICVMDADGNNVVRVTNSPGDDGYPAWEWPAMPRRAAAVARGRMAAQAMLRAVCAGQDAKVFLGAQGVEVPAGASRGSALRFVPLAGPDGRTASRTWEFAVEAPGAASDVTLSWPDLSGLGAKERVILEDLDATVRRSMRTTAAYVFRGERRRFRVTVAPRGAGALQITGLELVRGRSGMRTARLVLSTDATLDMDLLSPAGATVASLATGRACTAGANLVGLGGSLPAGIYLLRARAATEDGTVVQAVRPVVLAR